MLARAKGLSVVGVVDAGVLVSQGGKTRLVNWQDYPEDYNPEADTHRPVWEVCHHLVRVHQRSGRENWEFDKSWENYAREVDKSWENYVAQIDKPWGKMIHYAQKH